MTSRSLPMIDTDPSDAQIERLADIADEGLASMLSKAVTDPRLGVMTPGMRVLGIVKYTLQLAVRALRDQGVDAPTVRSSLIEVIDEELSERGEAT